ncbi:hypothetical protein [Mesorhizobium jarvisii]|uniref:hypothetical protein n=1 Tax=Mesorhizobium jarvisii TaxID=1777867 RepID=UPI000ADBCBAD|nr:MULTISPECIES: hypothetical protein [Mesorhizobium]
MSEASWKSEQDRRRIRRELRRVMERGLPQAIAANEGMNGSVQIVFTGRRAEA